MTGRTADLILRAAMGNPMTTAVYEGLCAGNSQGMVSGIAVCNSPSLDLLRRAVREKKNLIVSREHPFFLHGGLNYAYTSGGLEVVLKDDPVVRAKRELIDANGLMIYRFAGTWDQFRPNAQSAALAEAMDLKPLASPQRESWRGVVCECPETNVHALAIRASERLKATSVRTIGNTSFPVTRVAVLAGETDPKQALSQLLDDPSIGALIAGAGGVIDEVDGALSWFQDLIASGRSIALVAVGHGPSHEPGCARMAQWMRSVLPDTGIEYWVNSDPTWIPRS